MSQTKAQLIDNLVQPIKGAAGSASAPTFSFTSDPNSGLYSVGADQLALSTGGTGRLTIDSSGNVNIDSGTVYIDAANNRLGVGTTSPSTDLHVSKAASTEIRVSGTANGSSATIGVYGTPSGGGSRDISLKYDSSSDTYKLITTTGNDITIGNSAGEAMRIDGSRRVGIGSSNPQTLLHLSNTAQQRFNCLSTANAISFWKDGTPTFAAEVGIGGATGITSTMKFDIYNGSAWNTAMTIDSSSRVGIGTTASPVGASIRLTLDGSNGGGVELVANNNGGGALVPSAGGGIQFYTHTGAVGSESYSERMRITDVGELGINTSSPLSKLGIAYTATGGSSDGIRLSDTTNTTVSVLGTTGSSYSYAGVTGHNTLLYGSRDLAICADNANNGIIKFMAGGNERMRINTSGRLLIGTTTDPGYQLSVVGQNSYAFGARQDVGNWTYPVGTFHSTFTTGDNYLIDFYTDTISFRGRIDYNRAAGQIRYNVTSDQRLKSQIKPAGTALDNLLALQVRSYIWTETNYQVDFGFIAQELYDIVPDAVKAGDDSKEITDPWSVDNSKLVPLLAKALQETVERIKILEIEIKTLKG